MARKTVSLAPLSAAVLSELTTARAASLIGGYVEAGDSIASNTTAVVLAVLSNAYRDAATFKEAAEQKTARKEACATAFYDLCAALEKAGMPATKIKTTVKRAAQRASNKGEVIGRVGNDEKTGETFDIAMTWTDKTKEIVIGLGDEKVRAPSNNPGGKRAPQTPNAPVAGSVAGLPTDGSEPLKQEPVKTRPETQQETFNAFVERNDLSPERTVSLAAGSIPTNTIIGVVAAEALKPLLASMSGKSLAVIVAECARLTETRAAADKTAKEKAAAAKKAAADADKAAGKEAAATRKRRGSRGPARNAA